MEVIHVKINSKRNADLLIEMLSSMKFVSKVEKEDKTTLLPSKKRKPNYVGGSLKKYANKNLIKKEVDVLEMVFKEKHAR